MNAEEAAEERRIIVTAIISAIAEGVRHAGPRGMNQWALYDSVSQAMDRKAFDMIVAELIGQKTLRRDGNRLAYCGPSPIGEGR